MTVAEFLEKYNGAPYSLEEIALILAEEVEEVEEEDVALLKSAKAYLEWDVQLREDLEDIGFEFG